MRSFVRGLLRRFEPVRFGQSRLSYMEFMRHPPKSSPGNDRIPVRLWYITRRWTAGLLARIPIMLSAGTWIEPTFKPGEAAFLLPRGLRIDDRDAEQRLHRNSKTLSILPKPAKKLTRGGAPLQQLSFRQLMKQNSKALYTAAAPPPQAVSASEYITSKILGQLGCDASKNTPPCPSNGCGRCSSSSRIGESLCCNIHKECTTKTAGEYVTFYRLKRVCFPYWNV